MALQWHPYLVQFLREDYGDRLIIEEEVQLGDMPLRADLVIIRRDPHVELPFPFEYLGAVTLAEYCGPDEAAQQDDLVRLEIYGLLYHRREALGPRRNLTLWLMASRFARNVSRPDGAHVSDLRSVGRGVRAGMLDGFPTRLVNLDGLPLSGATLPLKMVTKGRGEAPLVEFLIEHHTEQRRYLPHVLDLHHAKLMEVLRMRRMRPQDIGLELDPLIELAAMFQDGEQALIRKFGEDRILKQIGEDRILEQIGEERALRHFGADRVREWLRESESAKVAKRRKPVVA